VNTNFIAVIHFCCHLAVCGSDDDNYDKNCYHNDYNMDEYRGLKDFLLDWVLAKVDSLEIQFKKMLFALPIWERHEGSIGPIFDEGIIAFDLRG
jgi:hypothetical protein